jgi:hypothetical protein
LGSIIDKYELVVRNDNTPTCNQRETPAILDLTISSPNIAVNSWSVDAPEHKTSSDHALISWSIMDNHDQLSQSISQEVTGWDINGMMEKELNAGHNTWHARAAGRPVTSLDELAPKHDADAQWISDSLIAVLQQPAKPLRICAWLKRWWNAHIDKLRRVLGAVKQSFRRWQGTTHQAVKNARRTLPGAIRKAKAKHWSFFLQNAGTTDTWKA